MATLTSNPQQAAVYTPNQSRMPAQQLQMRSIAADATIPVAMVRSHNLGSRHRTADPKFHSPHAHVTRSEHEEFMKRKIIPEKDQNMKVKRCYVSDPYYLNNTYDQPYDGFGWGVISDYSNSNTPNDFITLGAPNRVTPAPVVLTGFSSDLANDRIFFGNVFMYEKLTKISCHVVREPQQVTMNGPSGPNLLASKPGVVYQFPWAGEPDWINYNDGTLVEQQYPESYDRIILKKKFDAGMGPNSKHQDIQMTVIPMRPQYAEQDPNSASFGMTSVQYIPTPREDVDSLRAQVTNLNSYGGGIYWYHPELRNYGTGAFNLQIYWELEYVWYGLRASTATEGPDPFLSPMCTTNMWKMPSLNNSPASISALVNILEQEQEQEESKEEELIVVKPPPVIVDSPQSVKSESLVGSSKAELEKKKITRSLITPTLRR